MTNQIQPIVEVINNKTITYSTNIAEVFNKSHDDLFRKISKLEKDVRKNAEMFERCEYTDNYGRKQPCYKLNRDGAVLLIMGFTGKKALEFINNNLTRIVKQGSIRGTNIARRLIASLMRVFLSLFFYAGMRNPNIPNKVQYDFAVLVESQRHSFIGAITKLSKGGRNDKSN